MEEAVRDGWLKLEAVYGYWPALADGDTVIVYDPGDIDAELGRFTFPRQSEQHRLCLADYVRPVEEAADGERDVIALQVVTTGPGASALLQPPAGRRRLRRHAPHPRLRHPDGGGDGGVRPPSHPPRAAPRRGSGTPLLVGLPVVPRPGGPRDPHEDRPRGRDRGQRSPRATSSCPSSRPARSSCTIPRRATSRCTEESPVEEDTPGAPEPVLSAAL